MLPAPACEELNKLRLDALCVFREVKRIRRSRDLNFFEDADLNSQKYESLTILIKHLLAGHNGHPCPAGSRPIVTASRSHPGIRRNPAIWL
ncbi:MAG: hypothetical protein ABLT11_06495 [Candidatus Acidiferrum sp.]